jgi:hypothetical protein
MVEIVAEPSRGRFGVARSLASCHNGPGFLSPRCGFWTAGDPDRPHDLNRLRKSRERVGRGLNS